MCFLLANSRSIVRNGSRSMLDLASRVAMDGTVVLVFADSAYARVLDNWLVAAQRCSVNNYIVVAFDRDLYENLSGRGVTVWAGESVDERDRKERLVNFWQARFEVIRYVVRGGLNVIHSDADAVWMQNPQPYLNDLKFDLAFSQGTVWPTAAYARWGFVACCGFFLARSNLRTQAFLDRCLEALVVEGDDQVSVNKMLLQWCVDWCVADICPPRSYEGCEITCSSSPISGRCAYMDLDVTVLPHALFSRVPQPSDKPMVVHPVSDKQQAAKVDVLRARQCWLLSDGETPI